MKLFGGCRGAFYWDTRQPGLGLGAPPGCWVLFVEVEWPNRTKRVARAAANHRDGRGLAGRAMAGTHPECRQGLHGSNVNAHRPRSRCCGRLMGFLRSKVERHKPRTQDDMRVHLRLRFPTGSTGRSLRYLATWHWIGTGPAPAGTVEHSRKRGHDGNVPCGRNEIPARRLPVGQEDYCAEDIPVLPSRRPSASPIPTCGTARRQKQRTLEPETMRRGTRRSWRVQ